jgi:PAS domain S-box-containing protein
MERRQRERRVRTGRRLGDGRLTGRFDGFSAGLGAPRLLLIESHEETRLLYTCLFEEAGYSVCAVAAGPGALAVAQHRLPDVIVMAAEGAEAGAGEMLRRWRSALPASSPAPVVLITARAEVDGSAPAAGALLILEPGVTAETLLAEVDQLVRTAPRERAVVRQLRRSLLTLRALGQRFTPDESAQERLRGLIDRLQVAILVLDERGRHVAVSRGAATLTGYSRAELLGMSGSDAALTSERLFARPWPELLTAEPNATATTIRDKRGNVVDIHAAFATLVPGLHATAFAISQPAPK